MEIRKFKGKLSGFLKKYRFVAIILVAGLILMCLPGKKNSEVLSENAEEQVAETRLPSLEQTLGDVLSQLDGAGAVRVLLTMQKGEEIVYQTDSQTAQSIDNSTAQVETVIISGQDRNQNGLVKQVNPPTYMGAIVVCEGADSPAVRLAIVEAVSKVTGLGADRISVLKMK